jgi:hypothetical protein
MVRPNISPAPLSLSACYSHSGHAQSPPNLSSTPATLPRSISDATLGSQPPLSVGDNAPFQIPLSGPSASHSQAGVDTGSGAPLMRTEAQQAAHVPPSPFANPTNRQLPPRGPAHPSAQSLAASDPRPSQSPARSATATPSSSAIPPPLVDSRDSLQVQMQAQQGYQLASQQPHQQGMQLHPPPGSTPAPFPPTQQPPEPAIRQQRMLLQRGQSSAQLARQSFSIPTGFPNSTATGLPNQLSQARPTSQVQQAAANAVTHHLTPAQQHGLFPYQANPDNHGPSARGASQPLQSRPSSTTGGSGQQAITQPMEAPGYAPSREGYSEQPPLGVQSSQPPSDASPQASQPSARPSAGVMSPPAAPRPPSSHPGGQQGNGSPGLRRWVHCLSI